MKKNITNKILMVRPASFAFNEQTAVNNHYQKKDNKPVQEIQNEAMIEFDKMVEKLKKMGIDVRVMQDTKEPHTPDSIFPNNWFSTHYSNTIVLYPMFAENRRLERTDNLYDYFDKADDLNVVDYSNLEKENIFLEGTGALVLDRKNKKAYCSLSQRANEKLLDIFCEDADYKKIAFHSYQTVDGKRKPIYHTNVMMAMGENYAILCADSIDNLEERENVIRELESDGKEIVYISEFQVDHFLGNAIELINNENVKICVMSATAYSVLTDEQKNIIEKYDVIVPVDVHTIEKYGGGSARCMIAELFI